METISKNTISSPNVLEADTGATQIICTLRTAGTINSVIPYFLSLSLKLLAAFTLSGCVNLSSLICVSRDLFMVCCTILDVVPTTRRGSSSSLSLRSSVSSSYWSFPSSSSSELARSLKLSLIAMIISSNSNSASQVVPFTFSAFRMYSCSSLITVSPSSTCFVAKEGFLST